ncbi:MAG: OmpA family protein [Saprospiraceae bacterium]|nr:OmpA family protein [Saprospiraceae bacterium]
MLRAVINVCLILTGNLVLLAQSGSPRADAVAMVHFDFGKHDLRPDADSVLAAFYARHGQRDWDSVKIVAHTDAIGTLGANEGLSQRRARTIRDWLVQAGVDSALITLDWRGELDSVAVNSDDHGRQLNRRAEIRVFLGQRMSRIEGSVRDSTGRGIPAQIVVHGKAFRDSTTADTAGRFTMLVPDSTVLGLDIFHPGYLYTTEMFKSGTQRSRALHYQPRPIRRDVTFELHRFYFVGNQAVLLKHSEPELVRLLRFMQMNPTVAISIEGHVNFPNRPRVSRDSWEFDLSFRRAKLVYTYLVDQGIDPARLTFDGFGNWHMVYPEARVEAQMAKNRRVEIRITDY